MFPLTIFVHEKGPYIAAEMVSESQIMINSGIMRSADVKYVQKVLSLAKRARSFHSKFTRTSERLNGHDFANFTRARPRIKRGSLFLASEELFSGKTIFRRRIRTSGKKFVFIVRRRVRRASIRDFPVFELSITFFLGRRRGEIAAKCLRSGCSDISK